MKSCFGFKDILHLTSYKFINDLTDAVNEKIKTNPWQIRENPEEIKKKYRGHGGKSKR